MGVKVDCETLLWNQDTCLTCLPSVKSVLLQLHCHGNLQLLNLIQPRVCLSVLLLQCRQVISNVLILSYIIPQWLGIDITTVLQYLWYCSCVLLWAAWPSCACLQPPLPLSWQSKGSAACIVFLVQQSAKVGDCRQPLLAGGISSSPCRAVKHGVPVGLGGECCWQRELCIPKELWDWGGSQYLCSIHNGVKAPKDRPWLHKIGLNWEQGDRGCTSREWDPSHPVFF